MALGLNQGLLPPPYFAEVQVTVGSRIEIDVATFEEKNGVRPLAEGGVALWAPPKPIAVAPLSFTHPDLFEVQVINDEEGPRVVAAVELISPANKDRPGNRREFAVKCASYLQQGISVLMVDVVTERPGNCWESWKRKRKFPVNRPPIFTPRRTGPHHGARHSAWKCG